jgi:nucleotide-binding universal stress UspA family protein
MKCTQPILAATDLSAPARHAVERAFYLAAATRSELHILHATQLNTIDSLRGGRLRGEAARGADRERLDQLSSDAAIHRGVSAHARVVEGNPLAVITAEADALDAQLVVLGARGEAFLRHALLGSTAARLLRKTARRPVLVVKQAPHEDYRCVLVAVDFSPASLLSIAAARRLAPDAELVLLHAFELPYEGKLTLAGVDDALVRRYLSTEAERCRRRMLELATAAGLDPGSCTARVVHGDPAQQTSALEQEVDADLIVVGKHGSHIAEELLLGSVTKHVLAESQGDVLVIGDPHPAHDAAP